MARQSQNLPAASLADILERVLDKGIVVAGDIKVKLVDIELLTIQVRLVVCSVDKAMEMGMDWWRHNPDFVGAASRPALTADASTEHAPPWNTAMDRDSREAEGLHAGPSPALPV